MARVAMITEYKRIDYFMSDLLKIMVYEEYSRIKSHCRLVVDWITVKQPSEEKFPITLICSIVFYYKDKKRDSVEKVRVSLRNIKKGTGSLSQWKNTGAFKWTTTCLFNSNENSFEPVSHTVLSCKWQGKTSIHLYRFDTKFGRQRLSKVK